MVKLRRMSRDKIKDSEAVLIIGEMNKLIHTFLSQKKSAGQTQTTALVTGLGNKLHTTLCSYVTLVDSQLDPSPVITGSMIDFEAHLSTSLNTLGYENDDAISESDNTHVEKDSISAVTVDSIMSMTENLSDENQVECYHSLAEKIHSRSAAEQTDMNHPFSESHS